MTDDTMALMGCAIALLLAGGFLAVSYPLGRVIRKRTTTRTERPTVSFQVAERPAAETSDRKAA